MSIWFAAGSDGRMYNLCDCGDFESAEESAKDVLPEGEDAWWILDAETAQQWLNVLAKGLTMNSDFKVNYVHFPYKDRMEITSDDLFCTTLINTGEGLVVDIYGINSVADEPIATTYAFASEAQEQE